MRIQGAHTMITMNPSPPLLQKTLESLGVRLLVPRCRAVGCQRPCTVVAARRRRPSARPKASPSTSIRGEVDAGVCINHPPLSVNMGPHRRESRVACGGLTTIILETSRSLQIKTCAAQDAVRAVGRNAPRQARRPLRSKHSRPARTTRRRAGVGRTGHTASGAAAAATRPPRPTTARRTTHAKQCGENRQRIACHSERCFGWLSGRATDRIARRACRHYKIVSWPHGVIVVVPPRRRHRRRSTWRTAQIGASAARRSAEAPHASTQLPSVRMRCTQWARAHVAERTTYGVEATGWLTLTPRWALVDRCATVTIALDAVCSSRGDGGTTLGAIPPRLPRHSSLCQ